MKHIYTYPNTQKPEANDANIISCKEHSNLSFYIQMKIKKKTMSKICHVSPIIEKLNDRHIILLKYPDLILQIAQF